MMEPAPASPPATVPTRADLELLNREYFDLLRERDEQFRAVFESAFDSLLIADDAGRLLEINPAARRLLSLSDEAALDFTLYDLLLPDERPRVRQEWEGILQRGQARGEYRRRRPGGGALNVAYSIRANFLPGRHLIVLTDVTAQRRAAAELRIQQRALDATQTGIVICEVRDGAAKIVHANPAFERNTGYAQAELVGQRYPFLQGEETDPTAIEQLRAAIEQLRPYRAVLKSYRRDGTAFWNDLTISPVPDESGEVRHVVAVQTDVTPQQEASAELSRGHAILQATLEAVADGICLISDDGETVSYNARFAALWGLDAESAEKLQREGQLMAYVLSHLQNPDEFLEKIHLLFDDPGARTRDQVRLRDGRTLERYSAPARSPQGDSYGRVWSWTDITEGKRHEEQLSYRAFHDPVTGLSNRALFLDRLGHAITALHRSHATVGVLFLDLDRFKAVNDTLGHEKGDLLLKQAAQRLSDCLRPGDTAARFGGDEFTLLLEEIHGVEDAVSISERVLQALSEPFHLDGHEAQISASIGVVLTSDAEEDPEKLLRQADAAMYQAKSRGRAQYEIFDARLSDRVVERVRMEDALRCAVQEEQFQLYYHPQVDLQTGRITGAEALLRWRHPQRGLLAAAQFLDVIEETGLIVAIGQWTLRHAGARLRAWRDAYPQVEALRVSVNLSARQFAQASLADDVRQALRETGLPSAALDLEVSESSIMADVTATYKQLQTLKELGVQLSLDDFGTGYSSLSHLERFPLDRLKIDQLFVARLGLKESNHGIVRAICELGRSLGLEITAEGIETRAQFDRLRAMGCRAGQGYFFSQPLTADDFETLLRDGKAW